MKAIWQSFTEVAIRIAYVFLCEAKSGIRC